LTVIDPQGGFAHADGFGQIDQLTLEQEWQLIEAALADGERRGELAADGIRDGQGAFLKNFSQRVRAHPSR
jgi:hypothetical protein